MAVKVRIKDLSVSMELGNNGVTFDVYDNSDVFLGDLRLGRGTVEWCKGKTQAGNGIKVNWLDLIAFFEGGPSSKASTKTPKAVAPKKGSKNAVRKVSNFKIT